MDDLIDRVERLMGPREFFTVAQLVKMGIYGGKSTAWRAIRLGQIEAIQTSDRRWVVMKESIIKNLRERQKVK